MVLSRVTRTQSSFRYALFKNPHTVAPAATDAGGVAAAETERAASSAVPNLRYRIWMQALFLDPPGDPDFRKAVVITQEDFEVGVGHESL